ncbi:MAG: hypothetical protein M5U28_16485 [Sandaracinaceae bacterium]|nr:hypothetical protein [Sandaracinaceae bacterium]
MLQISEQPSHVVTRVSSQSVPQLPSDVAASPSPSMSINAWTHPVAGLQLSAVHALPSLQARAVPAMQVLEATTHVSTPLHALSSSHCSSPTHVNRHSLVQPSASSASMSSQSSPSSTMPLPQPAGTHTIAWHVPGAPVLAVQSVPIAGAALELQVCALVSHIATPLHASPSSGQSSSISQVYVQSLSHPSPSSSLPSSHSSPAAASTIPSPHRVGEHTSPRHTRLSPHEVPSASAVPGAHPISPHVSSPLHGWKSSHCASLVHVGSQVGSHPSNPSVFPSSHISVRGSTIPSPHSLATHDASTQISPSPHAVPSTAVAQSTPVSAASPASRPPSMPRSPPSHPQATNNESTPIPPRRNMITPPARGPTARVDYAREGGARSIVIAPGGDLSPRVVRMIGRVVRIIGPGEGGTGPTRR